MKKIIAAALSVLVGAFGYTIVDSAIEDRVATLESEVVELREEVSRYHPQNLTTTDPYEGSEVFTTEEHYYTTSTTYDSTIEDYTELQIGDHLTESSNSRHKFLLRKWSNGRIQYISPSQYGNSVSQFVEITNPVDNRNYTIKPTLPDIVVTLPEGETVTGVFTTIAPTTPTSEDYYLYITDTSAQITDISVEPSYYYDDNYSITSVDKQSIAVKFIFKGYTDPIFSGKKLMFGAGDWINNNSEITVISDTVNSNGTFEYCVIVQHFNTSFSKYYTINHITVK